MQLKVAKTLSDFAQTTDLTFDLVEGCGGGGGGFFFLTMLLSSMSLRFLTSSGTPESLRPMVNSLKSRFRRIISCRFSASRARFSACSAITSCCDRCKIWRGEIN